MTTLRIHPRPAESLTSACGACPTSCGSPIPGKKAPGVGRQATDQPEPTDPTSTTPSPVSRSAFCDSRSASPFTPISPTILDGEGGSHEFPIGRPDPTALLVFNPSPAAEVRLFEVLSDPFFSLLRVAREFNTTFDALSAWMYQPRVQAHLASLHSLTVQRNQFVAAGRITKVLLACERVLDEYIDEEANDEIDRGDRPAKEQRRRSRGTALKASWLIYRISRTNSPPLPVGSEGRGVGKKPADRAADIESPNAPSQPRPFPPGFAQHLDQAIQDRADAQSPSRATDFDCLESKSVSPAPRRAPDQLTNDPQPANVATPLDRAAKIATLHHQAANSNSIREQNLLLSLATLLENSQTAPTGAPCQVPSDSSSDPLSNLKSEISNLDSLSPTSAIRHPTSNIPARIPRPPPNAPPPAPTL